MDDVEPFDALPWHQRHGITDDVRRRIAETPDHDVEDIVRWTVNAYVERAQKEAIADIVEREREASYFDGLADGKRETEDAGAVTGG